MGFEFGMIASLDPQSSMLAMIAIVAFILTFDFLIGFLEFYLEESPLYNRMVQTIYKELMQMGIISLILSLYEALSSPETLHNLETAVTCMEFAHIVLFFVAIFLVIHAFFLMGVSIMASKEFVVFYNCSPSVLIDQYNKLGCLSKFAFNYSPLSGLREEIEFKILHTLFRDTYCQLPLKFDFSTYLQKCLQKYAMRTTEVSIFSWIAVVTIVVANYFRASYNGPLSCGENSVLILGHILGQEDDREVTEVTDHEHRFLEAAADDGEAEEFISSLCYHQYTYLFFLSAIVVTLVMAGLVWLSRLYILRLLGRAGLKSPKDYVEFISFCEMDARRYEEYRARREAKNLPYESESFRNTAEEVNQKIGAYFDDNEQKAEETQIYSFITEKSLWAWETCLLTLKMCWATLRGKTKRTEKEKEHHIHGGEILGGADSASTIGTGEKKRSSIFGRSSAVGPSPNSMERDSSKEGSEVSEEIVIGRAARTQSVFGRVMARTSSKLAVVPIVSEGEGSASKLRVNSTDSKEIDPPDSARSRGLSCEDMNALSPPSAPSSPSTKHKNNVLDSSNSIASVQSSTSNRGDRESHRGRLQRDRSDQDYFHGTTALSRYLLQRYQQQGAAATAGDKGSSKQLKPLLTPENQNTTLFTTLFRSASRIWRVDNENNETNNNNNISPAVAAEAQRGVLSDNFDDVFLFGSRDLFFRAVEVAIMTASLYMALWITNFITIVKLYADQHIYFQVYMVVPIVLWFWMVGQLAKCCGILDALTNISGHLDTVTEVLEDTADQNVLLAELRTKMLDLLNKEKDPKLGLISIFSAVDVDGSGSIDRLEFRGMLRRLQLRYSDKRFARLFRALDVTADNSIKLDDFQGLIFPELHRGELAEYLEKIDELDGASATPPPEPIDHDTTAGTSAQETQPPELVKST